MTYGEWLDQWLDIYKLPTVGKKQQSNCRHIVGIIQRSDCAKKDILDITEQDLQVLLNTAKKINAQAGYSKSVLTKIRVIIRQSFRPLLRNGTLSASPAAELAIPLSPTKQVLPLSHAEQKIIEAACREDALGHLVLFLLMTGLRKGEMMALKWEDYNTEEGSIFIRKSKTEAGIRKVYLISEAQNIIEQMPHINGHIFNHTRGNPVTPTVMRRLIDRLRRKTGVGHLGCHVCRHTFVTRLCEKGVPAKAIAQIIGHAKADYVLDIYAKLEADELRRAVYVLESDKDGQRSALMGATVSLPIQLYSTLQEEATQQNVSVDVLVTYLLSSFSSPGIANQIKHISD